MMAPTCRACGKPLKKSTRTRSFCSPDFKGDVAAIRVETFPTNKAEAQRYFNDVRVISVPKPYEGMKWMHVGVWDEKSWGHMGEGWFCNGPCAVLFARSVAKHRPELRLK